MISIIKHAAGGAGRHAGARTGGHAGWRARRQAGGARAPCACARACARARVDVTDCMLCIANQSHVSVRHTSNGTGTSYGKQHVSCVGHHESHKSCVTCQVPRASAHATVMCVLHGYDRNGSVTLPNIVSNSASVALYSYHTHDSSIPLSHEKSVCPSESCVGTHALPSSAPTPLRSAGTRQDDRAAPAPSSGGRPRVEQGSAVFASHTWSRAQHEIQAYAMSASRWSVQVAFTRTLRSVP